MAVVVSRFNEDITTRLRDGAVEALTVAGAAAAAIEIFEVPGAFEIPWAARANAERVTTSCQGTIPSWTISRSW